MEPPVSRRLLVPGGVRLDKLHPLGDGHVEGGGDVADAGQARGAVARGLVALDLLLGDSEHVSELVLAPAAGDAGLDDQRRQLLKR